MRKALQQEYITGELASIILDLSAQFFKISLSFLPILLNTSLKYLLITLSFLNLLHFLNAIFLNNSLTYFTFKKS